MRPILPALAAGFLLLVLTGCQQKPSEDFVSETLKEVTASPLTSPAPAPVTKARLRTATPQKEPIPPTGILITPQKIVIDANQTQKFLESLTRKLDEKLKNVERQLQQDPFRAPNPTGIVITPERVEIDLNQTERFMENWVKSIESIGKELERAFGELNRSIRP